MQIATLLRARQILPLLAGFGATMVMPQAGQAQDAQNVGTLEEVIVTAERRSEDMQKTAASVSVRSGEDLASEGKFTLRSILEDIPGMQGGAAPSTNGTGSGTDNQGSGLVIRGIRSNVPVGSTPTSVASAAAVYVDGVYEGAGGGYDIERVEALRGPQGTLYGRSATSGVVSIHTRNPQLGQFGGNVSVEVGNYDLRHYNGALNLPLGDTVALRVAGNRYERDAFDAERGSSGNVFQAFPGVSSGSSTDGRVKLLFQPSDGFSLLLAAAAQNSTTYTGGITTNLTSPDSTYLFTPNPSGVGSGENRTRQYWAELNWDVGFAQLTYLPAYRQWTSPKGDVFNTNPATGLFDQHTTTDKDNFWTHELHLGSKEESKLTWQVGAMYYDNKLHNYNYFIRQISGGFYRSQDVSRHTKAWSGFAEATYPLTDTWRVTGGLRYDSTKVQVDEVFVNNTNCLANVAGGINGPNYCVPEVLVTGVLSGDAGKRTFNNTTYKLRLEHDLAPDNMVYAMVSTGVSPGDVVLSVDLVPTSPTYNVPIPKEIASQTLTSYEIGSKNRLLDNRLQINGGVFYYDYGGYQAANSNVNSALVNGAVQIVVSPTQFEVLSAPVTSYGLELEAVYQATPDDRIGLDYAYTKAYYTDKTRPVPGTLVTFGFLHGFDDIPTVVPHMATLSYDHTFHLFRDSKLTVGGNQRWLSPHNAGQMLQSQLTDPNSATIYAYVHTKNEFVTNLNATWTSAEGMYSVSGWMRNVFDNRYKTGVNVTNPTVATNLTNGTITNLAGISAVPYDPRTYGISVSVKW